MAKNDVVKPGQFKLAGKLRPGQDTIPEDFKQAYTQEKAREEAFAAGELPSPGTKARRKAAAKAGAPGPKGDKQSEIEQRAHRLSERAPKAGEASD